MLQAVRVAGGLPGGALIVAVTDGEDTLLLCDEERWCDEPRNYDILNAIVADLMNDGDGDYSVEGMLSLEEPRSRSIGWTRAITGVAAVAAAVAVLPSVLR